MKTLINAIFLAGILALPQLGMAEDSDMPMMPDMQQGMGMQDCQMHQQHRMEMQQQMQDMQALMGKIEQEQDASQMRKMMHEHMGMMQHGMQMMGDMPSGGMRQHKRMQQQSMPMDDCQMGGQHMQMMQQMMQQMMMHMQMMERE